jgi:hypothetical protein
MKGFSWGRGRRGNALLIFIHEWGRNNCEKRKGTFKMNRSIEGSMGGRGGEGADVRVCKVDGVWTGV